VTFTWINQRDGCDCQSCAWGNPDRRKLFEFCENGAKALADEGTKKRITPEFFAGHSVLEVADELKALVSPGEALKSNVPFQFKMAGYREDQQHV
jgi:hypothetical protein